MGCSNPKPKEADFQLILESIYKKHPETIGLMIHVEAPEQSISWSGAVGYSDWEKTKLIEADQPGLIASITKTYVAVSVLRLIEQGKLDLNQNLNLILSEKTAKRMRQRGFDMNAITIAHLLSHKSGIPGYVGTTEFQDRLKNEPMYRWNRDEQIELAIVQGPMNPPATLFHYTDTNYLLLTEILERVTGAPFFEAIKELVGYHKFGLKETWFYSLETTPESAKPLIHQYVPHNNEHSYEIDNSADLYGGGGIAATTKDVGKFASHVFQGNVFDKKETVKLLFTDVKASEGDSIEEYIREIPCEYFLGIQACGFDGLNSFWHKGYWGTIFRYFPDLNATVVLFVVNEAEFDNIELDMMKQFTKILE
jgi:D-alanyl-D-alanine carboxypeptidase